MKKRGRPVGAYKTVGVKSAIGFLIGTRRSELKFSQKQVSKKLGMSVQQLTNIERGRSPLPAKYIKKVSQALSLDVGLLVSAALEASAKYKLLKKIANV